SAPVASRPFSRDYPSLAHPRKAAPGVPVILQEGTPRPPSTATKAARDLPCHTKASPRDGSAEASKMRSSSGALGALLVVLGLGCGRAPRPEAPRTETHTALPAPRKILPRPGERAREAAEPATLPP